MNDATLNFEHALEIDLIELFYVLFAHTRVATEKTNCTKLNVSCGQGIDATFFGIECIRTIASGSGAGSGAGAASAAASSPRTRDSRIKREPRIAGLWVQRSVASVGVGAGERVGHVVDPGRIKGWVTAKTRAIFIPNLAGSKPDWETLRTRFAQIDRRDVCLIEDSCDTMTKTIHSDISIISFYASHVITAGGGGGMVMCNSLKQSVLCYGSGG